MKKIKLFEGIYAGVRRRHTPTHTSCFSLFYIIFIIQISLLVTILLRNFSSLKIHINFEADNRWKNWKNNLQFQTINFVTKGGGGAEIVKLCKHYLRLEFFFFFNI